MHHKNQLNRRLISIIEELQNIVLKLHNSLTEETRELSRLANLGSVMAIEELHKKPDYFIEHERSRLIEIIDSLHETMKSLDKYRLPNGGR
jgi:hypothetical protein